jgi:hypothetical protein
MFEGRGPLAILLLVLVGGLALNLTPCVLPMIPINLAIIGAGAQAGSRRRGFLLGLAYGAAMAVVYGALGLIGLLLWRRLGLPEVWDARVTNRQRFLIPAIAGAAVGVMLIVLDLLFRPINGIGAIPHPPFPTSLVAALAAGIGEETVFRLFFISLWTWLISSLVLRGRAQPLVYWVVSVFSALAFAMSHLPSLMFLYGWTTVDQVPPMLMVEIVLLNGLMSLVGAYYFRKSGFLATAGIHCWADVVWHVVWGLVG